jgi:hypothetical protein
MSVFGLGRAKTLYGGLERVAIRPVHLRPEVLNIFFQLSAGRDALVHQDQSPGGVSVPQRCRKNALCRGR